MSIDSPRDDRARPVSLVVRRTVAAPPEVVFRAWTDPEALKRWWGPDGITCSDAEVDLRVGGRYRIANEDATGAVLWITGVFDVVEAPHRLVFSWAHEPVDDATDYTRVTVQFDPSAGGTEVSVTHELLPSVESRDTHEAGWSGCLGGLETMFAS